MDDEDDWFFFLGLGAAHDMKDAADPPRSRLWDLKSTSKAACIAADKTPEPKARKVGFLARRPR